MKRYWLMNVRTGDNWMCDAQSKGEAARKLGVKIDLLRIERMRHLRETDKTTLFAIPWNGC